MLRPRGDLSSTIEILKRTRYEGADGALVFDKGLDVVRIVFRDDRDRAICQPRASQPRAANPVILLVCTSVSVADDHCVGTGCDGLAVLHCLKPPIIGTLEDFRCCVAVGDQCLVPRESCSVDHLKRGGGVVLVIARIHQNRDADLVKIGRARDLFSPFASATQCGHQHGSQNADNADDREKFNQCETSRAMILGGLHRVLPTLRHP